MVAQPPLPPSHCSARDAPSPLLSGVLPARPSRALLCISHQLSQPGSLEAEKSVSGSCN